MGGSIAPFTMSASDSQEDTFTFRAGDGTTLFAHVWTPDDSPRGAICLVHGAGDHSGRYRHVAEVLARAGFALLAYDHRGHGKSGGPRGHVTTYDALLADVDAALAEVARRWPDVPRVLYGHSMGGNVALNYALRRRPHLAGVIATSPWLRLTSSLPWWRETLSSVMNRVWPSFTQATGLETAALSRDPAAVSDYRDDPLVHDRMSTRLYRSVRDAGEWALAHAPEFPLPLLLIHGTADRVTSCEATIRFGRQVPAARCELVLFDGFFHETHNDPEASHVLDAIISWLLAHVSV